MSKWLVLPMVVVAYIATSATTAAPRDRDHDGLPDRWERQHQLSTKFRSAGRDPDHLQTDLATRLAEGPARFDITVSIAGDGDVLDDPTVVWPEDRERVVIGHIDITGTADDRERDGDVLVFDPTRVTDGIALSDDQILQFRRTAYSESVLRRSGLHPA